jgi:hypothetical protein
MRNLLSPLPLCVAVLLSDVLKDVGTSYIYSTGTQFSTALERTCISLPLGGNLFSMNVA